VDNIVDYYAMLFQLFILHILILFQIFSRF